jgi:hypothetical protein
METYFEPLLYSEEKEILTLISEISELKEEDRALLEKNCIQVF